MYPVRLHFILDIDDYAYHYFVTKTQRTLAEGLPSLGPSGLKSLDRLVGNILSYYPGNTRIQNSKFDSPLEVRSQDNLNSIASWHKLVSHDFEFDYECHRAKVSREFEFASAGICSYILAYAIIF